jgi:hypothetical protein
MKSYIFWKEEPPERKWKKIPATSEALAEAIGKGAMFSTWTVFQNNGQPEPHRWGDFPLDFDCAEDPAKAFQEMKELCLVHLPELYGIDHYGLRFYASGSKGFHVEIPAKFFDAQDGDPYLPLIYRRIAASWKQRFNLTTLDLTIYSMGKGKMWRIPNVMRDNGRHKVPLTPDEVMGCALKS